MPFVSCGVYNMGENCVDLAEGRNFAAEHLNADCLTKKIRSEQRIHSESRPDSPVQFQE
jgi:hypothetical protein